MPTIEELFKQREAQLYKGTAKDSNRGFGPKEPFIEKKPNSPDRHDTEGDSRGAPIHSSLNQVERVGKVLLTSRGVEFLAKQPILRSQVARPDLKTAFKLGLEPVKVSAEILASQIPPVRGERFASKTFNDEEEMYHRSNIKTPLGSSIKEDKVQVKRGMQRGKDSLNMTGVVDDPDQETIDRYDGMDFVPFRFKDLVNKKMIWFRATINGISENISPEWVETEYTNRPFRLYHYKGVTRTVSFTFSLYALNPYELKLNWERYQYLAGLCYPAGYAKLEDGGSAGMMQPPFIELTVGNLYKNNPALINSIAMTIPDESPWEIGGTYATKESSANSTSSPGGFLSKLRNSAESEMKKFLSQFTGEYPNMGVPADNEEFKLPHVIEIAMDITILHDNLKRTGDNLYGFEPTTKQAADSAARSILNSITSPIGRFLG